MATAKQAIRAYCSTEEINQIAEQARKAGLSVSSFVKRVCLGFQIPSRGDAQARLELLKINADMARLGALQKMALSQGDFEENRRLTQELLVRQGDLKAAIVTLYRVLT